MVASTCAACGPRDRAAIDDVQRRARQGDMAASRHLGLQYACGAGVARDDVEGARWLRRAADAGSADAQYDLGTLYLWGRGVPRDRRASAEWTERAAAAGVPAAQRRTAAERRGDDMRDELDAAGLYRLSDWTFRGLGTPQSNAGGYALLARAAARAVSEQMTRLFAPIRCLDRH